MFKLFLSTINFIATMALCLSPYFLIIGCAINLSNNWLPWVGLVLGIIFVLITKPVTTIIKSKKEADNHIAI